MVKDKKGHRQTLKVTRAGTHLFDIVYIQFLKYTKCACAQTLFKGENLLHHFQVMYMVAYKK